MCEEGKPNNTTHQKGENKMNNITIHGRVSKDIELRFTQSQLAIAEISVACTSGKDDKKKTTWFDVKCFGKLAENVAASIAKGDTVLVQGRLETDEYTKKDGTKGKFTSLVADEVGVSCRWNVWVKDQTENTMRQVGSVGKQMPKLTDMGDEDFF